MKSIAVFCGSSEGASSIYKENALKLGQELAKQQITLIYGGANVGLMGIVANAALEHGGSVIGVLPQFLQNREIAHTGLTELIMVDSMHERKAKMAELADGFIALPGGPGTLEEYFEIFTWGQLGLHQKPCGLLNINQYFDPLVSMFDAMERDHFMQSKYRAMVITDNTPEGILKQFSIYKAPSVKTYLTEQRT
ncbi:TIGR00730 family Rossman fold protein [Paenibacillus aurantius]|uniref:Cytokinin riboside 5'-monophosphate phosphoribohydrolase n=1 Tax=Paenibacillus aurantius TaxID=2918900 RepID=A0AA96LFT3_9BACL|nr:TIGR00730 family Rossman fold protein [Paenibacillus aurantius]WJH35513.1 TIGR00730 family Rossman fold protein [Paenibacillus sp. CC-CFT747]WNQ12243.1 TIGR00730 family Rossman fold protein [Paenibacillus aurantius]